MKKVGLARWRPRTSTSAVSASLTGDGFSFVSYVYSLLDTT